MPEGEEERDRSGSLSLGGENDNINTSAEDTDKSSSPVQRIENGSKQNPADLNAHSTTPEKKTPTDRIDKSVSGGALLKHQGTTGVATTNSQRSTNFDGTVSTTGDGIHSTLTFVTTSPDTALWEKCAAFFASWLIMIWQLLLYLFIVGESTKPFCSTDEECPNGQICAADEPFCEVEVVPAEEDCPFLSSCNTWSTRLSIVFVLVFIVGSVIDDLDQDARTYRAGMYRLHQISPTISPSSSLRCIHVFVAWNIWALHYVRAYLIPFAAFCATVAIIYSEGNVTTQTVILNGLAVTFINSFDDALFGLLVKPQLQVKSASEMASANDLYIRHNDFESKELRIWFFHRLMCFCYVVICSWIVFNPINAIKRSPSLFLNSTSHKEEFASCDDFYSAITAWPTILLIGFSSLDKIVIHAPIKVMIRDFFLGPIFLGVFFFLVFLTMLTIYTAKVCP